MFTIARKGTKLSFLGDNMIVSFDIKILFGIKILQKLFTTNNRNNHNIKKKKKNKKHYVRITLNFKVVKLITSSDNIFSRLVRLSTLI